MTARPTAALPPTGAVGRLLAEGERPWMVAVSVAIFVVLAAQANWLLVEYGGDLTDARADWLVTAATFDGLDPFSDVVQLGNRYGVRVSLAGAGELGTDTWVHPRTPGALLLLAPAALIGPDAYWIGLNVLSSLLLLYLGAFLVPHLGNVPRSRVLLLAPLLLGSYPVFASLEFGTQSVIVAILVLLAWVRTSRRDDVWGGVVLGVAGALKLWPLLLIAPLWVVGRRRSAIAAVATIAGSTLLGVAVLGISPERAIGALSAATDRWLKFSGNGSAPAWLARLGLSSDLSIGLTLVLALVAVVVVARWAPERAMPTAIAVALLASPLSWEHYDIVLIAVVVWQLANTDDPKWPPAAWLGLAMFGMAFRTFDRSDFTYVGLRTLAGRILLTTALLGPVLFTRRGDGRLSLRLRQGR